MEENKPINSSPSADEPSNEVIESGDISSESGAATQTDSTVLPKSRSTPWVLWILTLINLAAVSGIVFAGYWFWPQYQAQQGGYVEKLSSVQAQSNQIKTGLSGQIERVKSQVETTQKQLQNQQNLLNNTEQQLQDFRRSLVGLNDRRPQDWLVAEAEYLVRVATRKLYLEQDIRTAIQLLEDADAQLASLQDDNLLGLRSVLAADIQKLKSLPINSTSDIILKLSGLLSNSDKLVFIQPNLEGAIDVKQSTPEPTSQLGQWKSNLALSWQAIKAQFAIRQFDGQIVPQMDEQQKWWLLQRYELLLTQAQSVALKREQHLYDVYLEQAKTLVSTYFAKHDAAVASALNVIAQLQTLSVEQPIPEALASLRPMQAFLESNAVQRENPVQNESEH